MGGGWPDTQRGRRDRCLVPRDEGTFRRRIGDPGVFRRQGVVRRAGRTISACGLFRCPVRDRKAPGCRGCGPGVLHGRPGAARGMPESGPVRRLASGDRQKPFQEPHSQGEPEKRGRDPASASSPGPSPERAADISALRGRLTEALNTLSEVQREIVLLHDLEGWKHAEIADRLGMPSGTVRSHLHFARKALRVQLAEWKDYRKGG